MITAVVAAAALAVGCASQRTVEPAATTASTPPPAEGSPTVTTGPIDPGLKPYIDIAVADLAQRLSVDAATIAVTSATLVEWPDSSLGCPQPGTQYAQVSTDGAAIVLVAGDKTYQYNAGGSRQPFLCESTSHSTTKPPSATL